MYGHPKLVKQQSRQYKPVGKKGRLTLWGKYLEKQHDLFPSEKIGAEYSLRPETVALMNRVHCVGCE